MKTLDDTPQLVSNAAMTGSISLSIVRGEAAIRALTLPLSSLLQETGQEQDIPVSIEYFLKANPLGCLPLVVLIRTNGKLVAALYGRERRLFGIRSGLVQLGDYYSEGCVIAKRDFKAEAFAMGALKVLEEPRCYWVRASFKVVNPADICLIDDVFEKTSVKARALPETVQHVLPLKSTFEGFLGTLGSHTRRNLRVYRRRVEQKQWKFVAQVSNAEAANAITFLQLHQGAHQHSADFLSSYQATLNAIPGAVYSGMLTDTGEWASLTAGWLRNGTYFMLVQMNDARYLRDSISTVMRSYLIEDLIRQGSEVINFIGGSSEPLRQFCTADPCVHYLLEKTGASSFVRDYMAPRLFGNSMFTRIVRGGSLVGAAGNAASVSSLAETNDIQPTI